MLVTFPFILLLHFVLFLLPFSFSRFFCLPFEYACVPRPSLLCPLSQLCKFLKANKLCWSLMSCRLAFRIVLHTKASRNLLESLLKIPFLLSFYQFLIVPFGVRSYRNARKLEVEQIFAIYRSEARLLPTNYKGFCGSLYLLLSHSVQPLLPRFNFFNSRSSLVSVCVCSLLVISPFLLFLSLFLYCLHFIALPLLQFSSI